MATAEELEPDKDNRSSGVEKPHTQHLRYQELFDTSPECLFLTEPDGKVLAANQSAATLLRQDRESLTGKLLGLELALGHREGFALSLVRMESRGGAEEFESALLLGGKLRPVAIIGSVNVGDNKTFTYRWSFRDVSRYKQSEEDRLELLKRLISIYEDERGRMSRELHDTVGQLIGALSVSLQVMRSSTAMPVDFRPRLEDLQNITNELGREAHEFALWLRPTVLDDLGLVPALQQLAEQWSKRTGVPANFLADSESRGARLADEVQLAFYRVAQEALTNVARYASAKLVGIVLSSSPEHLTLIVEDNGCGIATAEPSNGGSQTRKLGILGMTERMSMVDGTLEVESVSGAGTTVIARAPRLQA